MNIEYFFKNVDPISNEDREYIEKKIESINNLVNIDWVKINIEKIRDVFYHIGIKINCGGKTFFSEEEDKNLNACIDKIEDELKRQVRREKEKEITLRKRGGKSIKKRMSIDDNARF